MNRCNYVVLCAVLLVLQRCAASSARLESSKEVRRTQHDENLFQKHSKKIFDRQFLNLTVRAGATTNDQNNINAFNAYAPAHVVYLPPRDASLAMTDWQATGMKAQITLGILNDQTIGSDAYDASPPAQYPPGWNDIGATVTSAQRGHLLGKQLGGSGKDVRNIVALYPRANNPVMVRWENLIRNVYSSGKISPSCIVEYDVSVQYSANLARKHPISVTLTTTIFDPFVVSRTPWFNVIIGNEAVDMETVIMHDQTLQKVCLPSANPVPVLSAPPLNALLLVCAIASGVP